MRILLVEDEELVRRSLGRRLEAAGFRVSPACSIREAAAQLGATRFDVVLVDRRLPDGDGVSLCRRRRALGDRTAFVVLSGMTAEHEVVEAYDSSVDLYLRKPLGTAEIIAHLKAVLRRAGRESMPVGPLTFDRAQSRLILPDQVVLSLTNQERTLLEELLRCPDQVVPRESLADVIWGDKGPESNGLDVLAGKLRRKLRASSWMLETVRRRGFVLHTNAST